jgi:hypothetical protein
MSIVDTQIRTVSCNSCDKTATFDVKDQKAIEEQPWLKNVRIIQVVSVGRNFVYCSDECEIAGVASGAHNIPEEKKIVDVPDGQSAAAIQIAANAAKQAEQATKALKDGKPAKLQVVGR